MPTHYTNILELPLLKEVTLQLCPIETMNDIDTDHLPVVLK